MKSRKIKQSNNSGIITKYHYCFFVDQNILIKANEKLMFYRNFGVSRKHSSNSTKGFILYYSFLEIFKCGFVPQRTAISKCRARNISHEIIGWVRKLVQLIKTTDTRVWQTPFSLFCQTSELLPSQLKLVVCIPKKTGRYSKLDSAKCMHMRLYIYNICMYMYYRCMRAHPL